jgi:hypothetical protein
MTFTKKAANEVKKRLADKGAWGAKAMTIHSFGWSVLRSYHKQAGFDKIPVILSIEAEQKSNFGEAMRFATLGGLVSGQLQREQAESTERTPTASYSHLSHPLFTISSLQSMCSMGHFFLDPCYQCVFLKSA